MSFVYYSVYFNHFPNGNSIYFTRVKIPPAGEAPYFTGIWQCQQPSVSAQQYALTQLNLI